MMIIRDLSIVESIITSNEQCDIDIMNGIVEAYWVGCSEQGILQFRKVYPNQEIVFHVKGQKATIGVTTEIAQYFVDMQSNKSRSC